MPQGFKKFIPHFITLLNLLAGCVAVYQVSIENYFLAFIFVLLGVFFDFFDGLAARRLNVSSEIGVQLDSLADLITSGLAPGFVMFKLLGDILGEREILESFSLWVPYLGFIITAATAYRLAVFNVDGKNLQDFTGLAAPANALMILSWPLMKEYTTSTFLLYLFSSPVFLLVLILVDIFLLNGKFRLFSFKLADWSIQKNIFRYLLILLSLLLFIFLPYEALTLIILIYFVLSYFHFRQKKSAPN